MNIWQIIKQEYRHICTHPRPVLLLFGIPVLYVLFLGMVYSGNVVKYIPTVVYDQDQTGVSRMLVQAFADSERYNIVAYVSSEEEMQRYLREKKAQAAVVIPLNFARDIKLSRATEVLVEVNGANLMYANAVIASAQEIVQTFSAAAGRNLMEAVGQLPSAALNKAVPVRMGVRLLNNPTYAYSNFMLAGLGVNGLQLGLVLAVCTALTMEYRRLDKWKETAAYKIIAGKLMFYWMLGLAAFISCIVIDVALFNQPMRGNVGHLFIIGGSFVWAVLGVAMFVSAVAPDEVYAVQLPIVYIMPAFLFSGYLWPEIAMNKFSLAVKTILPLAYAADNVRDIMLAGFAPRLYHDTAVLACFGFGLTVLALAVFSFRRQRYEKKNTACQAC